MRARRGLTIANETDEPLELLSLVAPPGQLPSAAGAHDAQPGVLHTMATGVNYSKWDHFADSSDEEGEQHVTGVQAGARSAEVDFEHARRAQELDEEVTTDTQQLSMLRKQRKDVTEAIRAQSASTLPSSQWMLIGGSSFAKVPSKQVADTLNKGAPPARRSGGLHLATP